MNQITITNIKIDIENLRTEMFKQRFVNELQVNLTDINRIDNLKTIINNITFIPLEEIIINNNKLLFSKKWEKLTNYHRLNKIVEYINLYFIDFTIKQQLLNKLSQLLMLNKLNTKNLVIYDPLQQQILYIPCLLFLDKLVDENIKK